MYDDSLDWEDFDNGLDPANNKEHGEDLDDYEFAQDVYLGTDDEYVRSEEDEPEEGWDF